VKLLRAIAAWLFLRLAARRPERHAEDEPDERLVAPAPGDPRAEAVAAALLLAAAASGVGFVVCYALEASTQLLGIALGLALACVAVALVVLAHRVLPTEELEEEYPQPKPEEADKVVEIVRESGDGITRKGLLIAAGGAAGCAIGAAAVAPALSLGPLLDTDPLYRTPWHRGRRLVDEHNRPVLARDIEEGPFYTAFPQGARKDLLGAPLVLVRLPPESLRLPAGRAGWAPGGILAFSKICTHAGCAIALYRSPLYDPTEPDHALVCPCHYSTFDPATGGEVVYGPAGRPLPQLPLLIGRDGGLRAAGTFSGPVGPSFSGIRRRRPT
jgi:ubiquinol-cytochrome c reductase iron-sulfur subunit